jgi:hypothetical protein
METQRGSISLTGGLEIPTISSLIALIGEPSTSFFSAQSRRADVAVRN